MKTLSEKCILYYIYDDILPSHYSIVKFKAIMQHFKNMKDEKEVFWNTYLNN